VVGNDHGAEAATEGCLLYLGYVSGTVREGRMNMTVVIDKRIGLLGRSLSVGTCRTGH
jgi:hypothetical protein